MVAIPNDASLALALGPMPLILFAAIGQILDSMSSNLRIVIPSGFCISEHSFASSLFGAIPTEHDPNRGFFVAQLSSDEARQLYRMRQLLEAELLMTVEWPTSAQIREFKALLARLEELIQAGNREGWIELHRELHDKIFDLSPNKVLKREVLRLMRLTDRYRALAADISAHPQHRSADIEAKLVKALESKDRELLLATYEKGRMVVLEGLMRVLAARE